MNPQDDPEARIRDLERPLSEVASASEMGTAPPSPYAPQPGSFGEQANPYAAQANPYAAQGNPYPSQPGSFTAPPVSYGGAYPSAAPIKTASLRGCWIALGVFTVVAIAVVAGIAVFGAHLFSNRGSIVSSPSVRPSLSRRNPLPNSQPGGSPTATQSATGGGSTATAPPGGNLNISGIGENRTIVCNDSAVTVDGISNTIVLTGHCKSLTLTGTNAIITVDSVDTITTMGISNQVTFHSGSPTVQNLGLSDTVQQG
jgi:hypothetical protein